MVLSFGRGFIPNSSDDAAAIDILLSFLGAGCIDIPT
jgi:hypothetical protein